MIGKPDEDLKASADYMERAAALRLANRVNTARLVRAAATVPEICVHHVKLGQGCFCPRCPTAPIPSFSGDGA